ncbi:MAG TPA: hypothetical protein VEJ89_09165 [Myxococcaceae bacterium]|nr:hypothetical protein [Myxococcaceae bacterium]
MTEPARRRRLRGWRLWSALPWLLPGAAAGQSSPIVVEPTIIAPNYDRIFPGVEESLEAGADIARARSAAAVWYNPAGIVLTRRTQLSASSQGYELTLIGGTGIRQAGTEVSSLRTLPSFVGLVLGEEVIPWRNIRLGFALANPISWDQSLDVSVLPTPGSRTTYLAQATLQGYQAIAAVAWAASPSLRLGFAVVFPHTSASTQVQFSTENTSSTSTTSTERAQQLSGNVQHVLAEASLQWDVVRWLSLGLVVKTPGLRVFGGGSLTYQALGTVQGTAGSQSTQVFLRDTDATFDYRIPLELAGGVAVRIQRVAVELDLHWHQASGTYLAVGSTTPGRVVTGVDGQPPVVTTTSFPDLLWGTRGILNGSIGGGYRVSNLVTLHGGFYVSLAPGDARSPILQQIDLYGFRAGVSFTAEMLGTQVLSGSVGLGYEFGSSSRALVTDAGDQNQTLNAQTISILFALSYQF